MTPYAQYLPTQAVYPEHDISQTIGEIMEKHHINQLRIAETEKFPHVTYFLNGGREQPFEGESRILIPSPKVKTYDLMPEMRAEEITDAIIQGLSSGQYPLIIANFANADMVGHCGELPAAITAIEVLDKCFTKINEALMKFDARAIITADHGNAEIMFDESTGQKHTAHTLSLVPFLFVGKNWQVTKTHGSLIDIAPTILELMGLTKPSAMTGNCLLKKD
jgi:2,3-bisphosphoglycerate-independent phosphoglycerate mutase